ncbi:YchJ family protein [uncultured Microbacterium sp.]|uniref:YchJ family protein n=1 Tax=uncultured Microbacterium sp. TaxID=191216 RepID=UPI0025DDE731|nr:YchJ family protein [uncultured Microbacterium sp.]
MTATASGRCPCGSGDVLGSCCGPILDGRPAPTAERLMRSRYSAFSLGDAAYLLRSWHPSTRPAALDLDDDVRWLRLDVLDVERGGPFDTDGVVEFEAVHRDASGRGVLHERSRFVREAGRWFYLDGVTA